MEVAVKSKAMALSSLLYKMCLEYTPSLTSVETVAVAQGYCDAYNDGGGWLVVQRRKDGSVSFDRGWIEYEEGFGDLNGEFWYGL